MEFGGYAIYAFFSDEGRKSLKLNTKQEKTFAAGLRGYLRPVKIKVLITIIMIFIYDFQ